MALNPNISLAVKGIELQDPLVSYGRVQSIQNAQQQNQLAQMQMAAAQREQESTNALNAAYADAFDPATGKLDTNKLYGSIASSGFGSKLPAVQKGQAEAQAAQVKLTQDQSNLVDAKLKQSRQFLETIDPNDPSAPAKYLAWHQANHADPVLGPVLAARGVNPQDSRSTIEAAAAKGPAAIAQLINQSKLGVEKFAEMNKPTFNQVDTGGTKYTQMIPGMGGPASVVPGSTVAVTMTPYQKARLAQDAEKLKQETATGDWSPQSIELAAQMYTQTGQMPPVGMGKSAMGVRDKIMSRAAAIAGGGAPAEPGAAPTPPNAASAAGNIATAKQDKAAQTATVKDFTSGQSARRVTANNTAINHLDTMEKLIDDLGNSSDVRVFNAAANAFAKATGSTAPTNFDAARQLVASEVIKAVVNNGGGVKERQEAEEQFARANTTAQLKGVVGTYKELLAGQLDSLGNQYEQGSGRKDFKQKLTPATRKVLESRGQGAAAPAAPTASAASIPPAAIQALKAGQGTPEQFDAIFGAGAAARATGK